MAGDNCSKCGASRAADARFCTTCGASRDSGRTRTALALGGGAGAWLAGAAAFALVLELVPSGAMVSSPRPAEQGAAGDEAAGDSAAVPSSGRQDPAASRPEDTPGDVPGAPAAAPVPPSDATDLTASIVESATASSALDRHPADHAFDGRDDTAWNESAPGTGVGEWIEAVLREPIRVSHLVLSPGWDRIDRRGRDLFTANRYLTAFDVELDGATRSFTVPDGTRRFRADLGGARTRRLRIVARAVQAGTARWDDLCISEVRIFGTAE